MFEKIVSTESLLVVEATWGTRFQDTIAVTSSIAVASPILINPSSLLLRRLTMTATSARVVTTMAVTFVNVAVPQDQGLVLAPECSARPTPNHGAILVQAVTTMSSHAQMAQCSRETNTQIVNFRNVQSPLRHRSCAVIPMKSRALLPVLRGLSVAQTLVNGPVASVMA